MKLLECEGKKLFEKKGIPVPKSFFFKDIDEGERYLDDLGGRGVLKVQVLSGGRGKLGGVIMVDRAGYRHTAGQMQGLNVNNEEIHGFLLEEALDIKKEIYLGFMIDSSEGMPLFIGSARGGVEVESLARDQEARVCRHHVDPSRLFLPCHCYDLAGRMGLTGREVVTVGGVIHNLYKTLVDYDCEMAEINPLIVTGDGAVYAGDAKVAVNDDALFRQGEIKQVIVQDPAGKSPLELDAEKNNIIFIDLDGDVAVLSIGAGLTMTVLDMIKYAGGVPADFIDAKGGADPVTVRKMTDLVLDKINRDLKIKCLVITLVLSATQLSSLVLGITDRIRERGCRVPVIALVYASDAALNEMDYPTAVKTLEETGIRVFPQMKDTFVHLHKLLEGEI